jgi:hypothetical protein
VARYESGDGFGGVRIDQQDAQIVSLSQSRPRRGASEECLPSSLPAGKLRNPVRVVSARPSFWTFESRSDRCLQPAKPDYRRFRDYPLTGHAGGMPKPTRLDPKWTVCLIRGSALACRSLFALARRARSGYFCKQNAQQSHHRAKIRRHLS